MRYTVTLFVGLVCLVMLVGCGGGGGGGLQMAQPLQPSEPIQPVEPTVPEEPTEPEPTQPDRTDEEQAYLVALEAAREEARREGVSEGCIEQPELCDLASVLDAFRPTMTTMDGRQAPTFFTTETDEHGQAVGKMNVGFPRMDATHEQVSDYLENQVSRTGRVSRFVTTPLLYFSESLDPSHVDATVRAVQIINANLPSSYQIQVQDERMEEALRLDDLPSGVIYVDENPNRDPPEELVVEICPPCTAGETHNRQSSESAVDASHIFLRTSLLDGVNRLNGTPIMVHELLHALGLEEHVDPEHLGDSVLRATWTVEEFQERNGVFLSSLDSQGLQALYQSLDPGDDQDSINSLGPWNQSDVVVFDQIDGVEFGVSVLNGLARPYAVGPTPTSSHPLTVRLFPPYLDSVTFEGRLIGLSDGRMVTGQTNMAVDLETLEGELNFTSLALENGVQFLDGALSYDIAVNGYIFTQTGGDEGYVTGSFFGTRNVGNTHMGGVLQRDDISAAFAGVRP